LPAATYQVVLKDHGEQTLTLAENGVVEGVHYVDVDTGLPVAEYQVTTMNLEGTKGRASVRGVKASSLDRGASSGI
jgi:hypothetical protein